MDQVLSLLLADGYGITTRSVSPTWRKTSDAHLCRHATLTPLYERGVRADTLIAPITGANGLEVGVLRVHEHIFPGDTFGIIRVIPLPMVGPCRLPLVERLDMKALMNSDWIPEIVDAFANLRTVRVKNRIKDTLSLSMPLDCLILDGTPLLCPSVEEVGPRVAKLVINIKGKEDHPILPDGTMRAPPAAVDELVILLHPKPPHWQTGWAGAEEAAALLMDAWEAQVGTNVPFPNHLNPFANHYNSNEPADRWPRTVPLAVAALKAGGNVTIVNATYDDYEAYFEGVALPINGPGIYHVSSTNDLLDASFVFDYTPLVAGMSHLAVNPLGPNGVANGHANGHTSVPPISLEECINSQAIERTSTSVIGELRSISIDQYVREVGLEQFKFETYFDHI